MRAFFPKGVLLLSPGPWHQAGVHAQAPPGFCLFKRDGILSFCFVLFLFLFWSF